MKNYFWVIFLYATLCVNDIGFAQDTIKTKTGETIQAKLLKLTRKEATYKAYGDPEFSTYTLPYKELSSIQKEGEKPILFNHHLPRAYVAFSVGPPSSAIALGSFAKSDFDDVKNEPGFSKEGFSAKLDVAFYVLKKLGVSVNIGYTGFRYDYSAYQDAYNGEYPNGAFMANSYPNSRYSSGTRKDNGRDGNWQFTNAMLGPIYSVKLGKRITWDFKARVGPMQVVKPVIYMNSYQFVMNGTVSTVDSTSYIIERSKKVQLSYNLGTSFRIALSKRLALHAAADFVHTSPLLDVTMYTSGNGIPDTESRSKIRYNISMLNLSLGLAYQFKRKGNKYE